MHPSTVNLWHATTSSHDPGQVESCCESWLDEEEVQRANRFRKPTSRNQHVVGRGMARRLLGDESVAPHDIKFAAEVHGKPFVVEPSAAKQPFNVAHTDGLVMCGVGQDQHALVGVDVERLERRTDPGLASRYFSKPEIEFLNSKPEGIARRNSFLRIWTLKESFIKAIGTGLQTPLADFAFKEIDSDQPRIEMLNPELRSNLTWRFFSLQPRPGFIGAVAVACDQNDAMDVQIQLKNFDDLVS